jgi:hypothetical protein
MILIDLRGILEILLLDLRGLSDIILRDRQGYMGKSFDRSVSVGEIAFIDFWDKASMNNHFDRFVAYIVNKLERSSGLMPN